MSIRFDKVKAEDFLNHSLQKAEEFVRDENFATFREIQYYCMDGRHKTLAAVRLELDRVMDRERLQKAVDKCRKRMPYFFEKLIVQGGAFVQVPNEKPFFVTVDPPDHMLDQQDNDDFLMRLSLWENTVTMSMFHGLSDGSGIMTFLKLLLSEYYKLSGEEVVPPADLPDIDGEARPEEVIEPLKLLPEGITPVQTGGEPFYRLKGKPVDGLVMYMFTADRDKVMQYASSFDGSPNAIVAIALARVIDRMKEPEDETPVAVSIAINAKPILGCPASHVPCLQVSNFHYDKEKLALPEEKLHTIVRGRVILDASELKLYPRLAGMGALRKVFGQITDFEARRDFCRQTAARPRSTVSISYAGAPKWGSMEKHIRGIYSFCEFGAPVMEINFVDGKFCFALSAGTDVAGLAAGVRDYLDSLGFDCSELQKQVFKA